MKLFLILFLPSMAFAMKPCGPQTWLANQNRTIKEWKEISSWMASGKIVSRKEDIVPYPNCGLEDKSKCTKWDQSSIKIQISKWDKGNGPKEIVVTSAYCAPDPPKLTNVKVKLFGNDKDKKSFIYIKVLKNESK